MNTLNNMKKQTIYFYMIVLFLCSCKKQTTTSPNYTSKIVQGTYILHGYIDGQYTNRNRFHDLITDTLSIIVIDNSKIGFNLNSWSPYYSGSYHYDTLVCLSANDSQKTLTFIQIPYILYGKQYVANFIYYNYITNSVTYENYNMDSTSTYFHTLLQTP